MVSVEEATKIVQENLWIGGKEPISLLASMGRVLAENVLADRDFPPFDRVTMDGIAIRYETFENGQRQFPIAFIQSAGSPQRQLTNAMHCCEVMTGAILPELVDTVIRYEDVEIVDGVATIKNELIRKRDNIHAQGHDAKRNDILLSKNTLISAAEIPLMASVGKANVLVKALPRVALISTGDELVELDSEPLPHQIRKSNMFALAAAFSKFGIKAEAFHTLDNEKSIAELLSNVFDQYDVVILSGGVSKGKFDLIPGMLQVKGIEKKFHQISQRPGKPMLFGVGQNKVVFALPGNPVSTFLCYYRYVEPWLMASMNISTRTRQAILNEDFTFKMPLTYFLQVKIKEHEGRVTATPIPGGGSGDFVNLKDADGFLELPIGREQFKKGEAFRFISFR